MPPAKAAAVFQALLSHPTLQKLCIISDYFRLRGAQTQQMASEAFAALVAADSPALSELNISNCELDLEALGRVFDALRLNSHLRKLSCRQLWPENPPDLQAFARARVLPAVQGCASLLRELRWDSKGSGPAGKEVERILLMR